MSDNLFFDLKQELKKHNHNGFRRLFFKRRNPTYEATWQRVPDKYIKEWGSIDYSIDDTKVNFFKIGDTEVTLRNDDGYFNDVNDIKSFFFNSISRFKTLVKIESGYIDASGVELPTDSTAFIGTVGDELPIDAENNISLNILSLINIFDEVPGEDVAGLGVSGMRSDEIISKIRDHTDGSSNVIFRQYISATNWTIQTGTNTYNLATSTNLSNLSCLDIIKKLAEAEGFVFYISPNGYFNFVDRSANSVTVSTHVYSSTSSTVTSSSIVLWNKLENTSSVNNSIIGVSGTVYNTPQFISGKYNFGMYSSIASNYIKFNPISAITLNSFQEFALEFWFSTDWSCTNGMPGDGLIHAPIDIYYSGSQRLKLYFYPGDALYIECGNGQYYRVTTGLSWTSSAFHHFALVVDTGGIDITGEKTQVYLDNIKVGYSTNTSFNIATEASIYIGRLADTSLYHWGGIIDNLKVWDYAKTDYSDKDIENGDVYIETTTSNTIDVTETFCFVGLGKRDTEWGMTIKEKIEVGDSISKVYNKVVIQYDTATTSVVTKKESWTWGDSSSSYKFGIRPLEIKNEWMGITQATVAVETLYNEFKDAKREVAIDTKYIPHVGLLDQCTVKYTTPKNIKKNSVLWGGFLWGEAFWDLGSGENIDINYEPFKVISVNHNIDNFSSSFKLRDL